MYQRPSPPKRISRIDHKNRSLGLRTKVADPRPAQTAPTSAPVVSEQEVKIIQNNLGVPRADDTTDQIIGRLVVIHTCDTKLRNPSARCDKCKERIPEHDAQLKVDIGTHKWLETVKADGTIYRMKAIVKVVSDRQVLVHACSLKKERCYCSYKVPASQADRLVAEKKATWMPVERGGVSYEMHSSIVLSEAAVLELQAEIKKQKITRTIAVRRFKTALAAEGQDIRDDILIAAFQGNFRFAEPLAYLNSVFDGDGCALGRALRADPPTLADLFLRCIGWFWNNLVPKVTAYLLLTDAPKGFGKVISGGYDMRTLAEERFGKEDEDSEDSDL